MNDQEKIAELSKLLREAAHLGLTFDRGSAYISRSYITQQDALRQRIKTALQPVETNDSVDRKSGDSSPSAGKQTPGQWKYGVRPDGSIWLSIGDPHKGPHYQGDLVASEDDAKLIVAAPRMRFVLERVLKIYGKPHEYSGHRPEEWAQAADVFAEIDRE